MTTEPDLALDNIQGIVVPGFFKPHQALLAVNVSLSDRRRCTDALLALLPGGDGPKGLRISNGEKTLADREHHRQQPEAPCEELLLALGLSSRGLDWLALGLTASMPSPAFAAGMAGRAGLLGDTVPASWRIDGTGDTPDLLFVLAGDASALVADAAQALLRHLQAAGAQVLQHGLQVGRVRQSAPGCEHFGFVDGVSQPGIRGRWNGNDITCRDLPTSDPEHDLFGHPGQHLVWPGEFVLGQPASSPDPRLPGPVRPVPRWMHDGSFLVYRRLRQNVEAFHATMASEAARLRGLPGFNSMTAERLAALLVGRWPSGAPVSRMPHADCPPLGEEALLNNDFRFDDDTPQRHFPPGHLPPPSSDTTWRTARADPLGLVCPVASHIRKVNLRDQASDVGGASATLARRILRVGVPYDDTKDGGMPDRGLLFLSIQASIEDQFEFLQARWINSAVRPRGPGGNDMIVGRGKRRCVIFGDNMAQAEVLADEDFVTMTGGGYFFVPSLPVLRDLLRDALPPD